MIEKFKEGQKMGKKFEMLREGLNESLLKKSWHLCSVGCN